MIKKVFIFLFMVYLLIPSFSQENNITLSSSDNTNSLSIYIENNNSNELFINDQNIIYNSDNKYTPALGNHFLSLGETIFSNLTLMGINRFIRRAPYAYITWDSIYKNLTNPWVWDQDEFSVNHIGHPYQGSFYYVSGRSNNLPFWESALMTMFGSVTWELFAETETPSYNDLIVTTIGGITLGEMLHRLYFEASDINKLFSFIISPMTGINNAIWSGKINRPSGNIYSLSTKLIFGGIADSIFFKNSKVEGSPNYIPLYLGGGINIIYGNPYGHKSATPYEQFDLNVKITGAKNYYNVAIFSNGMIFSFSPWERDNLKTTMGLSLHYDFLFDTAINYSANSIGYTIKQKADLPHNWDIKWDLHLNYIMMGASDFYYLFNEIIDPETELENRKYDLGIGLGSKTSLSISNPIFGSLHFFYFLDWLKTIENSLPVNGSHGWYLIGVGSISYEHKIYKILSLGLEYSSYTKSAFYKSIEDTYEYNQFVNIYLKTQFK